MGNPLVKQTPGPFEVTGLIYDNHNALPDQPCRSVSIYTLEYIIFTTSRILIPICHSPRERVYTLANNMRKLYDIVQPQNWAQTPGADSMYRCFLDSIGIPTVEIRRSYDRLITTIRFPALIRWHMYIESGPVNKSWRAGMLPVTSWRHTVYTVSCIISQWPFSMTRSLLSPKYIFH